MRLLLALLVATAPPPAAQIDFDALDQPALLEHIRDGGTYHRTEAAKALARRGDRATPVLLGLLDDDDPRTRRAACDGLVVQKAHLITALPQLVDAVREDDDMWVRAGAADALGQSGLKDRRIDEVLIHGAGDGHSWVREAAMRGLHDRTKRKLVDEALPAKVYDTALMIAGRDEINYNSWRYAVPIIREGGGATDPRVIPVMTKLLGRAPHGMWGVKVIEDAAFLLEQHGAASRGAVPILTAALEKFGLPGLRIALARALGAIGPAARSAVPTLERLLAEEKDEKAAAAMRDAIARISRAS